MPGENIFGIAGLNPGGIGVYALLAAVLVALIKVWPLLSRLSIDARAAIRAEKRADAMTCQERIDAMERRLDASDLRANALERKVTLQGAAYLIVVTELHRRDPLSPAIAQAQALLREMAPSLPDIDLIVPG